MAVTSQTWMELRTGRVSTSDTRQGCPEVRTVRGQWALQIQICRDTEGQVVVRVGEASEDDCKPELFT